MSVILYLDTATRQAVVSVMTPHDLVTKQSDERRADQLIKMIDDCLQEVGSQNQDLQLIIVRQGLGSYTGLRVGVSAASALAWSLQIPIIGFQSDDNSPFVPNRPWLSQWKPAEQSKQLTTDWPTIFPIYQPWPAQTNFGTLQSIQ